MNKKVIPAFFFSLLIHVVVLVSYENQNSKVENTYAKLNGVAETKISIRILNTVSKVIRTDGILKKKKNKIKKQQLNSSGSKSNQSSGNQEALSKYLTSIRLQMVRNQYKSRSAIRLKQKGVVKISFNINAPNSISDIKILRPSSYEQLNYSAVRTVESLESIPSIPSELKLKSLSVQIDITYP